MNDPARTGDYLPGGKQEPTVDDVAEAIPQQIGRYRIEHVLGKGGFGLVYLAHDEQLRRLVAIKAPHRKLVDRPEAAEAYLSEARTVANLDHPNIVPVFDVGRTENLRLVISLLRNTSAALTSVSRLQEFPGFDPRNRRTRQ